MGSYSIGFVMLACVACDSHIPEQDSLVSLLLATKAKIPGRWKSSRPSHSAPVTNIEGILKYPIITENSIKMIENNAYTFAVDKKATKPEIKAATDQLFDVKVNKVNTLMMPVKKRRVGKYMGKRTQDKKAIVTLKEGDSIKFFEED